MREKIIVTGSEGLIGTEISKFLSKTHEVIKLDILLGHDLTDESFVKEWFSNNNSHYLVNCFALNDHIEEISSQKSTLFSISLDSVKEYLNINVLALFSVCREFAKNTHAKGIINFSSTYGVVSPMPQLYSKSEKHIGYSISKGAVIQLTRHLAVHMAPKIRINCIVPGGIEAEQGDAFKKQYGSTVPMGRMMHRNELNGLIKYLCSDESSYVTGSIISCDGGWTAI